MVESSRRRSFPPPLEIPPPLPPTPRDFHSSAQPRRRDEQVEESKTLGVPLRHVGGGDAGDDAADAPAPATARASSIIPTLYLPRDEYDRRIDFWDLRVGDQVYVSSYPFGEVMVASSIAVDNRNVEEVVLEMQGVAYFASEPMAAFFIFNTKIQVTPETTYSRFDTPVDVSEFFSVANNSYVKVRGYFEYGVLRAEHVQVFPPDHTGPTWYPPPQEKPNSDWQR